MVLRDHAGEAAADRLQGPGLHLDSGAVVTHLRIANRALAQTFLDAYADSSLVATPLIEDFRIAVTRGPRRLRAPLGGDELQAELDGEHPFPPFPSAYAFPMLESALNWCIAERLLRHLVFHAAAVERDGLAVLIAGASGAGKSTLCAALSQSGWRLLSDELVMLQFGSGDVVANPRPISLKNRAIEVMENRAPEARFSPRYEGTIRGTIAFLYPSRASALACKQGARLGLALAPSYRPDARPAESKMRRSDAFTWLAHNSVNYFSSLRAGFETLAEVADRVACYEIVYSDLDAVLERISVLHAAAAGRRAA